MEAFLLPVHVLLKIQNEMENTASYTGGWLLCWFCFCSEQQWKKKMNMLKDNIVLHFTIEISY